MAGGLLTALVKHKPGNNSATLTFQHKLSHDLESLIWVVVYAMMIRHRNTLATTDQVMYGKYKEIVDECWAGHSYSHLHRSHNHMFVVGCSFDSQEIVSEWFPDAREAAFFRDVAHLIHKQVIFGELIAYESLSALFQKHIRLAKEPHDSNVDPN